MVTDHLNDLAVLLAVVTPIVSGLTLLVVWFYHQKLGVSVAQGQAASARKEVVELQERRIILLEAEVKQLTIQVQHLSAENEDYRRRIRALEREIDCGEREREQLT